MSVNDKMFAIADNLRKYSLRKPSEKLTLDQMAEEVFQCFQGGHSDGYMEGIVDGREIGHEEGYDEGFEDGRIDGYQSGYVEGAEEAYPVGVQDGIAQGKQEQYDAFWDNYQGKGTRTSYIYAFNGFGFNSDNFYPKYNINIEGYSTHVFYGWSNQKAALDLKSRLDECGVTLDTSKATNISNMFNYSTNISRVPTIDVTGLSGASTNLFSNTYGGLKKIEKIITSETVVYQNWFINSYIEEIAFEGVIGQSIAFNTCPLTKASIQNIVEHLSTTSSGMTLTLKQTAVNAAFTTAEFEALKAPITNWTFSLV